MANKRQRKKQQSKQLLEKLVSVGVPKRQAKRIKRNPKEAERTYKEKAKYARWRRQADLLEQLGFKRSSPQRTWSEKKFNEWYQSELSKRERERKRREKKKKQENDHDLYLLMFWKDKTAEGYADIDAINRFKREYKHMYNEQLLELINHFLRIEKPQGAEIGTSHITVIQGNQRKAYIQFMSHISKHSYHMSDINDWQLVYEGKAVKYHELLVAVHAMIRLMYDSSERADFMGNLIDKFLPQININMATRLAKDTGFLRGGF